MGEKGLRRFPSPSSRPPVWVLPVLALLAGTGVASCTTNPVTGRNQLILMSEEDEQEIDAREAENVEEWIGIVDDPALNAYVDAVGQEMARYAPHRNLEYHFQVVEMDEPNAFALPGGHIYVSRGLLALSNSEAELANVLGHEVGHVAHRHAAARDLHSKVINLATILGTIGAVVGSGDGRAVAGVQMLGSGMVAAYGRGQEREADVFGQELARQAGVDPHGMSQFLRNLERVTRLDRGYSRATGYFDTHPATRERVVEARGRATMSRWQPQFSIARTHEDYLSRIDGLTIGKPASEGVVRDHRFLHPELRISIAFPVGWIVQNQRSRVLGIAPPGDAMVMLELQGPGNDAERAAREYAATEELVFESGRPVRIGGLDGYRARTLVDTPVGPFDAEVVWVAHRGRIYRLSAGAVKGRFSRYAGIFRGFGRSFRELRRDEEPLIDDVRLRIAVAQEGEGLIALSERTGNVWDPNYTAVMNGLVVGDVLPVGARIKVAVREPYGFPERGVDADAHEYGAAEWQDATRDEGAPTGAERPPDPGGASPDPGRKPRS